MKKSILFFTSVCLSLVVQAQVSKTIKVTAGHLYSTLKANTDLNNVTNLTVTGTIDARDFAIMRDSMKSLSILDLSGTTIAAYSGSGGTFGIDISYPANTIPISAFRNYSLQNLTSIIIPLSVTSIEEEAFFSCVSLSSFTIPSSVISIGDGAFYYCTSLTTVTIPALITKIGGSAFGNCSSLSSIYVYGVSPLDLSSTQGIFSGVNKNTCKLYVPAGSKNLYSAADQWKDFANIEVMK